MKRDMLSQAYTTRLADIPVVRLGSGRRAPPNRRKKNAAGDNRRRG